MSSSRLIIKEKQPLTQTENNLHHAPGEAVKNGASLERTPLISRKLRQLGSARFNGSDALNPTEIRELSEMLKTSSDDLPLDPHCPSRNRFRKLAWVLVVPGSSEIVPLSCGRDPKTGEAISEFYQRSELNPEDGDVVRQFAPIARELLDNASLRRLILFDLALLSWWSERSKPLLCGLHFIKHVAVPGCDAAASPDCLHRDGQPFTAAHLIESTHADGGEIFIAPAFYAHRKPSDVPPEDILARFTLRKALDSYIVKDVQVAHYVTPVRVKPGYDRGWRTILLVDFTPLEPKFV